MNIVDTLIFDIGRFTVRQQPRFDSSGWAQYLVFLDGALIGKSFSWPGESDCEWLLVQQRDQTMYAFSATRLNNDRSGFKRSLGRRDRGKRSST